MCLKWAQSCQGMEFDPIRQHIHFCPWNMSTAMTGPGRKLTLSALDREMTSSRPSLPDSPSSSMFEANDSITSVQNHFKSPSTKIIKTTHNSR
ncbi:hypothetical protein IFM89_039794 [Coptis chinensis]|uniref:NuBaID C-terminal domain-containing protein n=1 Tax=Coptis chinensis TaxID=261450 RepID=A0A835GVJ3_9MAGN|nr:hypothetical protein IFM89_039794 [Coptis chinensis]